MRVAMPALAATVVLAAQAVCAQPGVPTLPLHDVSVTYRLEGGLRDAVPGGLPETVRLQWDAAGRRLRVEPQGRNQVLIVSLGEPRAELLDTGLHGVVSLPVRAKDVEPLTLAGARLTRRGNATVAGLGCTEYDVSQPRGTGTVCLTADGVALRGAGTVDGRQGRFTAVQVAPGPVAESAFSVPPGYMRLAIPGMR